MTWLLPKRRTEADDQALVASGAAGGSGYDPVDGDTGYRRLGSGQRDVPAWTAARARAHSVAAYRTNPMAKAIIDTYTSFCVGDSGVTLQSSSPEVREQADRFWDDPRNAVAARQEALFRSHLLLGESALEMLVGGISGVTRFSYIDPELIARVENDRGNPLWPGRLWIRQAGADELSLQVVAEDDLSGLREGEVMFWSSFKALANDQRGMPFLAQIIDWLDGYDRVLWNLVDRTALARYLVWDVTVTGDQSNIDSFIAARQGTHAPKSGSVEVHNDKVKWETKTAQTGSYEDNNTAKSLMTSIAAGPGLAKTWLAEPEDANRATSISMAEPVRRRVGGVQNLWMAYQTEFVRFSIDRAVAARRLPAEVSVKSSDGDRMMRAADTIKVTGPAIAAADAQVNAGILVQLANSLAGMVAGELLTKEAAQVAAKKGWETFVGVPYSAELGEPDANPDDVATYIDDVESRGERRPNLSLAG